MNLKNHIKISLSYFAIAAVLGTVLRAFHSIQIPLTFKFIVHTHSHIALLGWVYLGLTTLLYYACLEDKRHGKKYRRVFWFTQFTLVGMLLSFPFQGYALFSIIFSTLFLFASYWFTGFFLKNAPQEFKKTNSFKCVKMALYFMVLSSIGPWALGAIMNTLGAASNWYRLAIYFYLHFQYNGWMILALFGVLFYIFERNDIKIPKTMFKRFFWSMNAGIVLTFFLSTLWVNPPVVFFILGGLGAILQIISFVILIYITAHFKNNTFKFFTAFQKNILKTVTFIFSIKIFLQLLTAFPYFSNLTATITDFTIGYLHWTFLGVVTICLFLFLEYFKLLKIPGKIYRLYFFGFLGTEGLIFYKGIVVWQKWPIFDGYFDVLTIVSLLIPLSLILLLGFQFKQKTKGV